MCADKTYLMTDTSHLDGHNFLFFGGILNLLWNSTRKDTNDTENTEILFELFLDFGGKWLRWIEE